MLQKLLIKNIALIDYAEIPFTNGLNVLSGETGAGKSVILESLNFVLGAKADKTLIRSGQNECSVVAEFNVENNSAISKICDELDFEQEDLLIISRKFTIDGKSSIKSIFSEKTGRSYDAVLTLSDDGNRTFFSFDFGK